MVIIAKVQKTFENSKVKAVCDVTLDGRYTVHGVKVIEGERGLFVQRTLHRKIIPSGI